MAKKDISDAAQKVANAEKATAKASNKADKPGFFKRAGKAIPKFFKDFKGEIKKIVWPDLKTVVKSTGVVLVAVLIIGIFIWIVDFGLTKGIDSVRHLASSRSSASEVTTVENAANEEVLTAAGEETKEEETKEEETKAEETKAEETTVAEAAATEEAMTVAGTVAVTEAATAAE